MDPNSALHGTNVCPTNKTQKPLIDMVRQYQQIETAIGTELVPMLRENYPPRLLCNSGILCNRALMRRLQQFLKSKEVEIAQHESGTLMGNVARRIYEGKKANQATALSAEYQQSDVFRSSFSTI